MAKGSEPIQAITLGGIRDFNSFREFLIRELGWPIPADANLSVEDLSYAYLADQLQLKPEQAARVKVRQLIPFHQNQPWGIFLLEFNSSKLYRTSVRQAMRALGPRRQRDPKLPQWHHEHLLFICTNDYRQFTFGHFSGERATAARLTTFTLDPDSPKSRTLREYNLPELRWPAEDDGAPQPEVWLKQWKKAFDKEALTDRFFKTFRGLFVKAAANIRKNNPDIGSDDANTEAQVILERMLFLYFLQRKGWLNQQPDYLYQRFREIDDKNPDGTNYYANFLGRAFQQLSSHQELYSESIGRLPFLNGGLFEDDPVVYSRDTQRRLRLKVSNVVFREIFSEMLERFNFTVREDTPLNQDVAVDPEMLGKILESLVLEMEEAGDAYAPDRRKATGSYYTPRIVVHFICREVLRQYLLARLEGPNWPQRLERLLTLDATDGLGRSEFEALREILSQQEAERIRSLLTDLRTCDPAVGSGAFPVGLLHELVNLWTLCEAREREKDPTQDRNYFFAVKKRFIENSIYGVDVLERAIEICKLRLWLSLIVDYDLRVDPFECTREQFAAALKELPPLPNLAFKIRRGDALLDQIRGHELILEEFVRREGRGSREGQDLVDEMVGLKAEYFSENGIEEKRRLQIRILDKQWELAERFVKQQIEDLPAIQVQGFFGETEKEAEKRRWREQQEQRLQQALREITHLQKELEATKSRKTISDAQARKLAELEGQIGPRLSFVWHLDFAEVFNRKPKPIATLRGELLLVNEIPGQMGLPESQHVPSGFDIIVGNPPFVTARNPERREAYRKRWPTACYREYQLVAPFFVRSFGVLAPAGELGFIVSNGFAKREFGRPLVEDFFSTVDLRKVVDCSGLMFPGHGTPTCIVFGARLTPNPKSTVRNVVILPGGGDLHTSPEASSLWHTIAAHHSAGPTEGRTLSGTETGQGYRNVYEDFRIAVGDCNRSRMLAHPCRWTFVEWPTFDLICKLQEQDLRRFLKKDIGRVLATSANDIYILPRHIARICKLERRALVGITEGDDMRDWFTREAQLLVKPYDDNWSLVNLDRLPQLRKWLSIFRKSLGNRKDFDGTTYEEAGRPWFEYHQLDRDKAEAKITIAFPDIVTHSHFRIFADQRLFKDHSPVMIVGPGHHENHLVASLLNSSGALFWLKHVCFSKRESEEAESDTYYEFAGGKVEELPVPGAIAESLQGKPNSLAERLTELSGACWERGQQMPSLSLKKLFAQPGEAYHEWNNSLPGYVPPNPELFGGHRPPLQRGFETADELREAFVRAQTIRERLRAEMIALQEEMDWLVYAAYGLLPENHPAVSCHSEPRSVRGEESRSDSWKDQGQNDQDEKGQGQGEIPPLRFAPGRNDRLGGVSLDQAERPFRLWQQVEGDYAKAVALIPASWPAERRALWEARLAAIRDNEHIRRIEQPVYKRRWDEQWKVGNQWRSGPVAYAAEFVDAFEWWLREKSEWWLENKKAGGPVELDDWAAALWKDSRVQAAWAVAAESYAFLESDKDAETGTSSMSAVIPAPPSSARLVNEPPEPMALPGMEGVRKPRQQVLRSASETPAPDFNDFRRDFKRIVEEGTVPEGFPFGVSYDDLEKKQKKAVPAKLRKVRGKLNVPRERFHLRGRSQYFWAGLQFKD